MVVPDHDHALQAGHTILEGGARGGEGGEGVEGWGGGGVGVGGKNRYGRNSMQSGHGAMHAVRESKRGERWC